MTVGWVVAEEELSEQQAAIYFATTDKRRSLLEQLQIDPYGNITNWPPNFFGDELGDLVAMTDAAQARQMKGG